VRAIFCILKYGLIRRITAPKLKDGPHQEVIEGDVVRTSGAS
jgi:hypothetical protein